MPNNASASNPFPSAVTREGYQQICGCCSAKETVHLYTGNLMSQVDVVRVPTVGVPLDFLLTYNSLDTVLGTVGHRWTHNYMMRLILDGSPVTYATFVSSTGRHFGFTQSGGDWALDLAGDYGFFSGILTHPGSDWRITYPDGSYDAFDSNGNQTQMVDPHGNSTTLAYAGGLLSSVTEPTGRQLLLGYTSGLLTSVTDPRSNTTTLVYDTYGNLTVIAAPSGCTTTYGYATPSDHRITSRTDSRSNTYTFSYDGSGRLYQVTDAETPSHTITYAYDLVSEQVAGTPVTYQDFPRTRLTDARSHVWEYRFDLSANLRRVIDPLGHARFFYWDQIVPGQGLSHQKLLYENAGNSMGDELIASQLKSSWRKTYDNGGNLLYEIDANGRVTRYTYDSARNVTSSYAGQAHLGVQGNWVGQYGSEGHVLCSFLDDIGDVQSLPSYVSGLTTTNVTRLHQGEDGSTFNRLLDPRTLVDATSLKRGVGAWSCSGTDPQISVGLHEEKSFNLSFYTCANFLEYFDPRCMPLKYGEQFGFDLTITVEDLNGTQSFRVYNTAPGVWVTFPVKGDATHPISVTVVPNAPCEHAGIWAMMFDPYDNQRTTCTYNATNDPLTVTDGLGNQTVMTYNADGTRATVTDALSRQTRYFYEDTHKNRTRVVDPCGEETSYTFDANGNVLTVTDPNLHVTTQTYDANNRLKTVTDPLGQVTTRDYDNTGNLVLVTDANGHETECTYTATNRLATVTDALDHETSFGYDGSGNRISVTDANGHTTLYAYDSGERLAVLTLPDGNVITYAYDGLDRVRAVTTPNGNQSPSGINLRNAFNWLRNPGMEDVSPQDPSLPWGWTPGPSNARDTTVSHFGQASARLGAEYWSQSDLPLPSGVSALMQFWARPDGEIHSSRVWPEVWYYGSDGGYGLHRPFVTEIAGGSSDWVQTPPFVFSVPGDGQFLDCSVREVRLYGQTVSSMAFDDATLYALSTAYEYDREGRPLQVITPDGAQVVYQRDRYGRTIGVTDARGKTSTQVYDSLGRVTATTDALGNTTTSTYDAVGNQTSVTDPRGNTTEYEYDDCNRLIRITYPDLTTELFSHDPAGNLQSYTNNRGQQKTFGYDAANRRISTCYETDQTCVLERYDAVGNRVWRTERNGDVLQYTYDALNRLVGEERLPYLPGGVSWLQAHQYDNMGNRVGFSSGVARASYDSAVFDVDSYDGAACFDSAVYDGATYAVPTQMWSATFDVCNRMTGYTDALEKVTSFTHDVEGRRSSIIYPDGSPAPVSAMTYDIVGKLMGIDTVAGTTDLLPLSYGYDLASNRVALMTGTDTLDYAVDAANQLVQEDLNRFLEKSYDRFSTGTVSLCTLDPSTGAVSLLPCADALDASSINCDRWRFAYADATYVGLEVRPMEGGLQFCFPRGFCNNVQASYSAYGLNGNPVWVAAEHRQALSGDFDVSVDFSNYQGKVSEDGKGAERFGALTAALCVSPEPFERITSPTATYACIARDNTPRYQARVVTGGVSHVDVSTKGASDTAGRFRIARKQGFLTLYYWDTVSHAWTSLGGYAMSDSAYVALYFSAQSSVGSVAYSGFQSSSLYPTSGTYTSSVYDAGRSVSWGTLSCYAVVPGGTGLHFQAAVSESLAGPWTYVGPDGTSGTSFTSFPAVLPSLDGRYFRYRATLTGDSTATPELTQVEVTFAGTNASTARSYAYDAAGNMTLKVTSNPSGAPTMELRDDSTWSSSDRINNLNQILRNDVTTNATFDSAPFDYATFDASGASLTTYRYAYDASGNLTSKTDGTNTWHYQWDEDNRLTLVTLPDTSTIAYTYDVNGRMLTRTDSTGTLHFEWDGFDCVRETPMTPEIAVYGVSTYGSEATYAGSSTALYDTATYDSGATFVGSSTQYYVVQGQLLSMVRDGIRYAIVGDALGSVRMVTGSDGAVVARFDYDAWGNLLDSSFDDVPGGMPYRFVGAYGVRWDEGTGLHYMRHRWYDAGLGRFLSRDPIGLSGGINLYAYVGNSPATFIDPLGLQNAGTMAPPGWWEQFIAGVSAAGTQLAVTAETAAAVAEAALAGGFVLLNTQPAGRTDLETAAYLARWKAGEEAAKEAQCASQLVKDIRDCQLRSTEGTEGCRARVRCYARANNRYGNCINRAGGGNQPNPPLWPGGKPPWGGWPPSGGWR